MLPTRTVTLPVVAPTGTVVVILVVVLAVTIASVPLNRTVLLPGVALKFVPVIVTACPNSPEVGVKLVIVGTAAPTVKFVALTIETHRVVTTNNPVVAPAGTVTVKEVSVAAATVAGRFNQNLTSFSDGVVLKFVPVMVTVVPIGPDAGENEVSVGMIGGGPCLSL